MVRQYSTKDFFRHLRDIYVERSDHIDAWRVLDGSRDVPQWIWEPGEV